MGGGGGTELKNMHKAYSQRNTKHWKQKLKRYSDFLDKYNQHIYLWDSVRIEKQESLFTGQDYATFFYKLSFDTDFSERDGESSHPFKGGNSSCFLFTVIPKHLVGYVKN